MNAVFLSVFESLCVVFGTVCVCVCGRVWLGSILGLCSRGGGLVLFRHNNSESKMQQQKPDALNRFFQYMKLLSNIILLIMKTVDANYCFSFYHVTSFLVGVSLMIMPPW